MNRTILLAIGGLALGLALSTIGTLLLGAARAVAKHVSSTNNRTLADLRQYAAALLALIGFLATAGGGALLTREFAPLSGLDQDDRRGRDRLPAVRSRRRHLLPDRGPGGGGEDPPAAGPGLHAEPDAVPGLRAGLWAGLWPAGRESAGLRFAELRSASGQAAGVRPASRVSAARQRAARLRPARQRAARLWPARLWRACQHAGAAGRGAARALAGATSGGRHAKAEPDEATRLADLEEAAASGSTIGNGETLLRVVRPGWIYRDQADSWYLGVVDEHTGALPLLRLPDFSLVAVAEPDYPLTVAGAGEIAVVPLPPAEPEQSEQSTAAAEPAERPAEPTEPAGAAEPAEPAGAEPAGAEPAGAEPAGAAPESGTTGAPTRPTTPEPTPAPGPTAEPEAAPALAPESGVRPEAAPDPGPTSDGGPAPAGPAAQPRPGPTTEPPAEPAADPRTGPPTPGTTA